MTKTESDNNKVVVLRNKTNEGYFVRDILDNSILNHQSSSSSLFSMPRNVMQRHEILLTILFSQ